MIKKKKLDWASRLIVRVMTRPQYLKYAIYAAEQVIDIYEKNNQNERPRKAIEAAKKVLASDTKKNRSAAAEAATFASGNFSAVGVGAECADYAAGHAACAAAYVDVSVNVFDTFMQWLTKRKRTKPSSFTPFLKDTPLASFVRYYDAGTAASYAANAVTVAAYPNNPVASKKEMQLKILNYGIGLLKEEK